MATKNEIKHEECKDVALDEFECPQFSLADHEQTDHELYDSVSGTITLSHFAGKKRNLASVVAYDGECKVWTNLVTRACDDPSPKDRRLWLRDWVCTSILGSLLAITASLDVSFRLPTRAWWRDIGVSISQTSAPKIRNMKVCHSGKIMSEFFL